MTADPKDTESGIEVVDTHVHLVSPDTARYTRRGLAGFHGGSAPWHERDNIDSAAMIAQFDRADVQAGVVVQPFGVYGFDNAYAIDSVLAHRDLFASVLGIDPFAEDALVCLDRWLEAGVVDGLRVACRGDAAQAIEEPRSPFWTAVAKTRLPVCLVAEEALFPAIAQLAQSWPDSPLVVDHLGAENSNWGIPISSIERLAVLSKIPNAYMKLSTVNLGSTSSDGDDDRRIPQLVDLFGAERIMWGSNYPASAGSYESIVEVARRIPLSADDRASVLSGTARSLWSWGS